MGMVNRGKNETEERTGLMQTVQKKDLHKGNPIEIHKESGQACVGGWGGGLGTSRSRMSGETQNKTPHLETQEPAGRIRNN